MGTKWCHLTENASDSAGEACHAEEITEIGLDVVCLDSLGDVQVETAAHRHNQVWNATQRKDTQRKEGLGCC